MFRALAHITFKYRVLVVIAGAAFLAAAAFVGSRLFPVLSSGGYDNPRSQSAQVTRILDERFGGAQQLLVVLLTAPPGQTVDSPDFQPAARAVLKRLAGTPGITSVTDPFDPRNIVQFVAQDRRSLYAVAQLGRKVDHRKLVHELRRALETGPLQVDIGGAPAVDTDVLDQVGRDLKHAEVFSLPLTAVLLVIVFGSLLAALLPLAMGGLSILGAFLLLRLLVFVTPVSVFAVNVVTMLGMGLAIDYSLFIVSRFREELRAGADVEQALVVTLSTAGHTVLFSGLTVTLSLLSLLLFPQMLLRSMGLGGSLGVLVAMAASLTVLPAILAILGPEVSAFPVRRVHAAGRREEHGFWYRLSHLVMRHPVAVGLLALAPLLVAGSPFLHVRFSMPDERNIPQGLESRIVAERLRTQYPEGETSPVEMVVRFQGVPAASKEGLDALFDWVQTVKKVPGVARVVSLASLDPRLDSKFTLHRFLRMVESGELPEGKLALEHFASGGDTHVQVFFRGDPRSDAARALVERLRALPPPQGATVLVGGITAELIDLLKDMGHTVPRAVIAIVVTIFVLLFLMLGSLVVPLKAVVLNFLSLTVTFGGLVWVFQDGHLVHLLGAERLGSIDALQPVLIFVIAFGLSMDYEVFLLSRIKETYDRTHDNTQAVALGIERTGRIITSAALLLAVVILGFATGRVLSLKQVGLGLLLAVLVDATLVRSLLVPATMRLLGRANWWAPPALRKLYERLSPGRPQG